MEGWRQNARKRRRRALPERSSSATLFARMHFDIAGSSAVKAQDELPALGLDCAPRRPNTLAIRAIGKNSMTSQYTTLDTDRPSHGRPMHSLTGSEHLRAALKRSSSELSSPISMSRKKTLYSPGVISSTPNSSKRNTSLMKILFLCQLMSPLLLTRRNWSPFGYVNSNNLRGSRIALGM